jgi:hypothetical protein
MEPLTYTITRGVHERAAWHLTRSDGMQLVVESWPCEFDMAKNPDPSIEAVAFSTHAQAERFVTLHKAGVPVSEIDYGLGPASGTFSLKWAAR